MQSHPPPHGSEPPYVPGHQPGYGQPGYGYGTPPGYPAPHHQPGLPRGLQILAIVVSVLKALPLALGGLALAALALLYGGIDTNDDGLGEFFGAVFLVIALVFLAIFVVAGILLGGQALAAARHSRGWLIGFAAVLSVLDVLAVLGQVAALGEAVSMGDTTPNPGSLVSTAAMATAQIAILVWAVRSKPAPSY